MRNRNQRLVVSVLFAGLAVLVAVVAGSCGGRSPTPAAAISPAAHQGSSVEDSKALEKHLKELDKLPLPEGVDPKLWASLKERMRKFLNERYSGKQSSYYEEGYTHYYVVPRDFDWDSGGDNGRLTWIYVNDGDYNQDSEVSVGDVTPLAIHYGEAVTADNTIQELIDEDDEPEHDPEYNGDDIVDKEEDEIGEHDDVETIFCNFGVNVDHYQVCGSTTGRAPWSLVGTVDFADHDPPAQGEDRYRFHWDIPTTNYAYYKVTPYNENGMCYNGQGVIMRAEICLLPVVTEVKPPAPQGEPEEEITFEATVEGPAPDSFTYFWTFCEHASPRESTLVTPKVTFDEAVVGTGTVCVSNIFGDSEVFMFPIDIRKEMPPVIDSISPTEGDAGAEVTLSAEVRGAKPYSWQWDFKGGATPNNPSGVSPGSPIETTVTLGEPGVYENCTLTVSNGFPPACTYSFDLTVHGWAFEDVDTGGTVGTLSLARDQNDNPGIAYQTEDKHLMYAWREGGVWHSEVAEECYEEIPGVLEWRAGKNCSLAFNSEPSNPTVPEPAIAYERVKWAWDEDKETWLSTVDQSLRFARLVAGDWETPTVDPYARDADPSLAFDGTTPYISYYKDLNAYDLNLAHEEPPLWVLQIIDYEPPPPKPLLSWRGRMSSMVIDFSGQKRISYLTFTGLPAFISELKLARTTENNLSLEVVDSEPYPSLFEGPTSIALDPNGYMWIAYLFGEYLVSDPGYRVDGVKVARETANPGNRWQFYFFDQEADSTQSPSLKITPQGTVGMSYCSDYMGSYWLKYVENIDGQWGEPEVISENAHPCSLAFTGDGRPSIAYRCESSNNLMYVERW